MQVSYDEILHIAKLANLNLKEEEVQTYLVHLQDILNFANIVSHAPIEGLEETIGAQDGCNVFRKDEVKQITSKEELLQNAPEQQGGMFKIPKVMNG